MEVPPTVYPRDPSGPHDSETTERTHDVAVKTPEKARELGRTIVNKLESGRAATADALKGAADSLHRVADNNMGMDRVMAATHQTADAMDNVAEYVRDHDPKQMMRDLGGLARKYPGATMVAGAIAGFLIARSLRQRYEG